MMQAAEAIDWDKAPSRALSDANAPLYEWFTDAQVNTCYNAIDRHVAAHADLIVEQRNTPAVTIIA